MLYAFDFYCNKIVVITWMLLYIAFQVDRQIYHFYINLRYNSSVFQIYQKHCRKKYDFNVISCTTFWLY